MAEKNSQTAETESAKRPPMAPQPTEARAPEADAAHPLPLKREAPMKPLNEMRFTGRDFKQNEWVAIIEKGTTLDHVLNREFWANNAAKLREFDKIIVMAEDRRLYAELIVFAVGSTWAEVRLLCPPIVVTNVIARSGVADDFEVVDGGIYKGWCVRRISDGRFVKEDGTCKTEDAARQWLAEYLRAMGRRTVA